jgi:uncharacterized protein YbbC (DUF1343 family)
MDLILGDKKVRKALEHGESVLDLEKSWQDDLDDFDKLRQEIFLYN